MYFRLSLFLAVSAIVISCSKTPNGVPSVNMSPQPIHEGTPDGAEVTSVGKGNVVYFLGETSPDGQSIKVDFNGTVGWIRASSVVIKSDAAIIVGSGDLYVTPDNATPDGSLSFGTITAVDSVVNERSHIFYEEPGGDLGQGWLASSDLSFNPTEIEFALKLTNASDYSTADRAYLYEKLFVDYPDSKQIGQISIDLSELPAESIPTLQGTYAVVVDKAGGKVMGTRREMENEVETIGHDILSGPVQYSFSEIKARSIYYQRYLTQLPSFVGLPSISDYNQYIDNLGEEQSWRAYLLYRVDRSPQNISRLYDAYGAIIRRVAESYPLKHNIRALMIAYEHIITIPNYKKVCADVYDDVNAWDKEHEVQGGYTEGGAILEFQQKIYDPIMTPAITESWDITSAVWYHGFWVRRLKEGNAEVVYSIMQDLDKLQYPEDGAEELERRGNYEEINDEPEEEGFGDDPFEPATTVVCTFESTGLGDCWHVVFDCGDYGDADISLLSEEDKALWKSLSVSDSEGESSNPAMVGKKFEINARNVHGELCGENGTSPGIVAQIISFKKVD